MRKKENTPDISFFSFQDIITSLTGIMFLIVLLLVLFLLDMNPQKDPSAQKEYQELQRTLTLARESLAECRRQISRWEEREKKLSALDLSVIQEHLESQKNLWANEKEKMEHLKAGNREMQRKILWKQEELRGKETQLSSAGRNREQTAQRMQQLQQEKTKLLQQIRNLSKTVRFTVENQSAARPFLVECRKDGIRILDVETQKTFDLRVARDSAVQQMQRFSDWLKTRESGREYYTFLVAPGAFEYAQLSLAMQDMGIGRGLEFLPDDECTIFGEDGGK